MCNNVNTKYIKDINDINKNKINTINNININNTNTISIKCKYCNSEHIKCNGNKYNKQRYYCNDCHKSFSLTDNKRDIKQRELCLLLYSHNVSMRSIQNVINLYFNTNISFRLIEEWIKTSVKLLSQDIRNTNNINNTNNSNNSNNTNNSNSTNNTKPKTIKVVEMDENKDRILENK